MGRLKSFFLHIDGWAILGGVLYNMAQFYFSNIEVDLSCYSRVNLITIVVRFFISLTFSNVMGLIFVKEKKDVKKSLFVGFLAVLIVLSLLKNGSDFVRFEFEHNLNVPVNVGSNNSSGSYMGTLAYGGSKDTVSVECMLSFYDVSVLNNTTAPLYEQILDGLENEYTLPYNMVLVSRSYNTLQSATSDYCYFLKKGFITDSFLRVYFCNSDCRYVLVSAPLSATVADAYFLNFTKQGFSFFIKPIADFKNEYITTN